MVLLHQELQKLYTDHNIPPEFWQNKEVITALEQIEQGSSYLTALCKSQVMHLPSMFEASADEFYTSIKQFLRGSSNIHQNLRIAKKKLALYLGLQSVLGKISTAEECYYLSLFADLSVKLALQSLWPRFIERAKIKNHKGDEIFGFFILGLGKLGGFELNYSSDIDLIALFDPAAFESDDPDHLGEHLIRLCKRLSQMLEAYDKDGYVFRVDFRLRPDPASTPLVMSVSAAEAYYEYHGQNWERCAMIKARIIAGDQSVGEIFLQRLLPFLWRKNLDYAAIREIHGIKKRIYNHKGGAKIQQLEGHNIKLGRGGIREIEFFAQAWQLIWGGRDPEIRIKPTCEVLQKLALLEYIPKQTYEQLQQSYWFLRFVEHRLQMMNDQQTHKLPEDQEEFERLAKFCGFTEVSTFNEELTQTLELVEYHYAHLFENSYDDQQDTALNFLSQEADEATMAQLLKMNYHDPFQVDAIVRKWFSGKYPAFRSSYGRELIVELAGQILQLLSTARDPQKMLIKCDAFFSQLSRGVQFFTILHANEQVLSLFIRLLTGARSISDSLIHHPHLLEALVTGEIEYLSPSAEELEQELSARLNAYESNNQLILQDYLDIVSRWAQERRFILSVQSIYMELSVDAATKAYSDIAEIVVRFLLPYIHQDFALQHGYIENSEFAIIALGKLGSQEMTPASDLDLIFIYDASDMMASSDGKRPLHVAEYYAKLCKRILSTISAYTSFGALYEVDMRLRPSGNKGPIAINLERFSEYQRNSAWTWEHMALTKARVIAGSPQFRSILASEIQQILMMPRGKKVLRQDIKEMRQKIHQEKPSNRHFDLKYQPAGLVDMEFMIEYLLLYHASQHASILQQNNLRCLIALKQQKLITNQDFDILYRHYQLIQILQFYQRYIDKNQPFEILFTDESYQDIRQAILSQSGHASFSGLQDAIATQTQEVQKLYQNWINEGAYQC